MSANTNVCAGDTIEIVFRQIATFERTWGEPIPMQAFLELLRKTDWSEIEAHGIWVDLGALIDLAPLETQLAEEPAGAFPHPDHQARVS